jgi:hypothetical protein
MRTDRRLPVDDDGQEEPGADHMLWARPQLRGSVQRRRDRRLGLRVGVAWMQDRAVAHRRRAADNDVRADSYGAGVGGGILEAAAVPQCRSCHPPLNVIVFSVENALLPLYCQISYTAEPMSPFLSKSTGLNAPS